MINLKSPINKSTLYSDTVYIEYEVTENSSFTNKVVFVVDGVKYEKQDLFGRFSVTGLLSGKHSVRAYLVNKSNKIIVGSEKKVSFDTNDDIIVLQKKLSDVVTNQIPTFIRDEYQAFVSFINHYYQYLEQSNNPNYVPFAQKDFSDVDFTPEILMDRFKSLFIPDFPAEYTVDKQTGKPLNIKTLIKRAKEFYQSKGTEKSFSFLFRILFDDDIEIFYPRTQIMTVSGGQWIQRKTIKVKVVDANKAKALIGNVIYQLDQNGLQKNRATVVASRVHKQSPYTISELDLKDISGVFDDSKIYCDLVYQDAEDTFEFTPKRGIGSITITNPGQGYAVGDLVRLLPVSTNVTNNGVGYVGRVNKIDADGAVEEILTVNFGFNYENSSEIIYELLVETVSGIGLEGTANDVILMEYPGYYKNSKSVLGGKNFLQDNYYYQSHSYEIQSKYQKTSYEKEVTRMVHPAGFKMFGKLVLKPTLLSDPTTLNDVVSFRSNFIGNYLPYRISSTINLRQDGEDLFPEGFNPTEAVPPQTGTGEFVHDPLGSPITTSVKRAFFSTERTLPEVDDIYQKNNYWVVFPHPSANLNTNETIESFLDLTIESMAVLGTTKEAGDTF